MNKDFEKDHNGILPRLTISFLYKRSFNGTLMRCLDEV